MRRPAIGGTSLRPDAYIMYFGKTCAQIVRKPWNRGGSSIHTIHQLYKNIVQPLIVNHLPSPATATDCTHTLHKQRRRMTSGTAVFSPQSTLPITATTVFIKEEE